MRGDLRVAIDFRRICGTILEDWSAEQEAPVEQK
jgi:hypothetical protein